jgi:hypothetical protein
MCPDHSGSDHGTHYANPSKGSEYLQWETADNYAIRLFTNIQYVCGNSGS